MLMIVMMMMMMMLMIVVIIVIYFWFVCIWFFVTIYDHDLLAMSLCSLIASGLVTKLANARRLCWSDWNFSFDAMLLGLTIVDTWLPLIILLIRSPVRVSVFWWVPNPPGANARVAERASWRSSQSGVAGVRSLVEIPSDSYHFPWTSDTFVRPQ